MENYERMKIPTLKNLARERGLHGYSTLKKSELIKKLREPIQLRDRTRAQLIQLARERGLTRYHSLKKAELIQRLREHGSTILDRGIGARMANMPILTPTPYTPPPPSPSSNVVEDLEDYLDNVKEIPKSVSPRLKKLQEEIKSIYEQIKLFEVRESNSALRNFARVYTFNGIHEYDARTFLLYARRNITRILRNKRRTKVKLILKCLMEKGIIPEEIIIKPADFHSDIEVNLDGTDEDDLYVMMTERILEKLATFQSMGSGWTLRSIIRLELHTVSYNPLRGETWVPLPKELADKKAIINMQNEDNKCFCGVFLWH